MFLVDLIELRHGVSAIGTVKRSELEVRQAWFEAELELVKAVWEGVAHLLSISASQDCISQILGGVMKGTDELQVDLGGGGGKVRLAPEKVSEGASEKRLEAEGVPEERLEAEVRGGPEGSGQEKGPEGGSEVEGQNIEMTLQ